MHRKVIKELKEWKVNKDRKPLIIKGARQVGKTWIMKEFGSSEYEDYVYFNFDRSQELKSIFEIDKDPYRLIEQLGLLSNKKIYPEKTLIIFDEIQESSAALNSLKYFKEEANEYHIVTGGSLLGTLLAKPQSYPVGMVNIINMEPMTFDEFLLATDEGLYKYYNSLNIKSEIAQIFHDKLINAYKYYLIIGGMPECVKSWIQNKDPNEIRQIQNELTTIYENDFTKHNNKVNSAKILMVFRSLVTQLAKDNEKFIYGSIKSGARARDYEEAIEWLVSAGIVNRVYGISKPEHLLNVYRKLDVFKLFIFDTGLLKHMASINNSSILLNENFQFKGTLAENYVLQQIKNQSDAGVCYYSEKHMEIDFVIQQKISVIPIEVKSGENKAAASFKKYIKKFNPDISIRFSQLNLKKDGKILNIPLYLANKVDDLL